MEVPQNFLFEVDEDIIKYLNIILLYRTLIYKNNPSIIMEFIFNNKKNGLNKISDRITAWDNMIIQYYHYAVLNNTILKLNQRL